MAIFMRSLSAGALLVLLAAMSGCNQTGGRERADAPEPFVVATDKVPAGSVDETNRSPFERPETLPERERADMGGTMAVPEPDTQAMADGKPGGGNVPPAGMASRHTEEARQVEHRATVRGFW